MSAAEMGMPTDNVRDAYNHEKADHHQYSTFDELSPPPILFGARLSALPYQPAINPFARGGDCLVTGARAPDHRRLSQRIARIREMDRNGPFIPTEASSNDKLNALVGHRVSRLV